MPIFNVAGLNPGLRKKSGGTGIGMISDQIQILENELGKDGYLSPGDYDILIEKAEEVRNSSGLSNDQRSNYDVKISGYEKNKSIATIDKTNSIERLNKEVESEAIEDVMVAGNRPDVFIQGRVASTEAKLNSLLEIIERRETAGQDTVDSWNEYQETLRAYTAQKQTQQSVGSFDGKNPIVGQVAYVKTNARGEIIDVDYASYGSKSGYVETNGTIDGFQVYGKVNDKKDGKNMFVLGGTLFSAPDILRPDPESPGSFVPTRLVADVKQMGPFTVGEGGYVNMESNKLQVQSYIPRDSWAKGTSGTLYKRRNDGGYTKYINVNQSREGVPDAKDIMTIHPRIEENLMRGGVDETIDYAEPMIPDEGDPLETLRETFQPEGIPEALEKLRSIQTPIPDKSAGETLPAGKKFRSVEDIQEAQRQWSSRKTPQQPKQQASPGIFETAKRTIKSGIDYVKSKF